MEAEADRMISQGSFKWDYGSTLDSARRNDAEFLVHLARASCSAGTVGRIASLGQVTTSRSSAHIHNRVSTTDDQHCACHYRAVLPLALLIDA